MCGLRQFVTVVMTFNAFPISGVAQLPVLRAERLDAVDHATVFHHGTHLFVVGVDALFVQHVLPDFVFALECLDIRGNFFGVPVLYYRILFRRLLLIRWSASRRRTG